MDRVSDWLLKICELESKNVSLDAVGQTEVLFGRSN